jgi:hypothetical protein
MLMYICALYLRLYAHKIMHINDAYKIIIIIMYTHTHTHTHTHRSQKLAAVDLNLSTAPRSHARDNLWESADSADSAAREASDESRTTCSQVRQALGMWSWCVVIRNHVHKDM